jgi:hypothetical protein
LGTIWHYGIDRVEIPMKKSRFERGLRQSDGRRCFGVTFSVVLR